MTAIIICTGSNTKEQTSTPEARQPQVQTYIADYPQNAVLESRTQPKADYISIPGFETITMKANTTQQQVRLHNPEQNNCYFLIKILMPNGEEIYSSDLLAPGESTEYIQITTRLTAGIYKDAILHYSCFSMDNDVRVEKPFNLNVKVIGELRGCEKKESNLPAFTAPALLTGKNKRGIEKRA